jgi:glycosyltransferase involved in cell wall biosynthesis
VKPSCVYIIDDASTDDSYEMLLSHSTSLNLKVVRHTLSVGPFLSKNLAIHSAIHEFDFISLLDSDDYLTHDAYYQLWKEISSSEEAYAVYPHCVRIKGIEVSLFSPLEEIDVETRACFAGMFAYPKVFQECGYFDCVRYGADGEFDARLKNLRGPNAVLEASDVLYFAELREGSLTCIEKAHITSTKKVLIEKLSESRVHYSQRFTSTSTPRSVLNFPKNIYESMRIFKSVAFNFDNNVLYLESENMRSTVQKASLYLKVSDISEAEAMFWLLIQYGCRNQIHYFRHTASEWGYIV